ncbi:heparan sulfate 2-O-sulfotransferase pipe-like [Macrobrachium nipponense]|uniref:heparan sulfate 2-O-sulfotransferase pipe-like n=1 Tax=Macrobrachium nipponense TaxID=159736 RepID=UPI0030C865B9
MMNNLTAQMRMRLRVLCSCMALILVGYAGVTHLMVQHAFSRDRRDQERKLSAQRQDATPHGSEYIAQHLSEQILFFNRVPKTGSEMLVLLLQWLQGENTFRHIRLRNTVNRFLSFDEQLELAADIGQKLHDTTEHLVSFDRHVYFTNFTNLGLKMPIYLNIIRDPLEKMESRFYYARVTPRPGLNTPPGYRRSKPPKYATLEECILDHGSECAFITGHHYDLSIPYFCGHHEYCRELNNEAALRTAKLHVEEWYPVVGVLEDINATLTVLEHKLPRFFRGVTDLYYNDLLAPHHNKNRYRPRTSKYVEDLLRRNLTDEYDFYNFVRQRLNLQYRQVNGT